MELFELSQTFLFKMFSDIVICLSVKNKKLNKAAVPAADSAFKLVIAIANVPPFRRWQKH